MRLADALAIRLDGREAIDARLNGVQVWPANMPPIRRRFGNEARGPHSFGTSNGRCVVARFTLPEAARDLVLYHFLRLNFAGACSMRGVVLQSAGGEPGALVMVSDPQVVPATPDWVAAPLPEPLPVGTYYIGAVCSSDARVMEASDAPVGSPGATRLATDFNFANPPVVWPGSPGSYVSVLSCFVEYTPQA